MSTEGALTPRWTTKLKFCHETLVRANVCCGSTLGAPCPPVNVAPHYGESPVHEAPQERRAGSSPRSWLIVNPFQALVPSQSPRKLSPKFRLGGTLGCPRGNRLERRTSLSREESSLAATPDAVSPSQSAQPHLLWGAQTLTSLHGAPHGQECPRLLWCGGTSERFQVQCINYQRKLPEPKLTKDTLSLLEPPEGLRGPWAKERNSIPY